MIKKAYIPTLLGVSMAIGVWLGSGLTNPFNRHEQSSAEWLKIEQILQYVESDYVDTISKTRLEDEIIAYLMQRLDPHSHYISEQDLASVNEPLEGNFEGIGVQFNLRNDSIYVINTIEGGPSEKAGLMAGDLIVRVDSEMIAGTGLTNRRVTSLLKGPKGSKVQVGVIRNGASDEQSFTITRGEIPINSIDAAYLIGDSIIYVRLARFSKNTYDEFKQRVYPLKTDRVTGVVLDLRGNGGGYLDAAVDLADEFLPNKTLITYTEGRSRPRTEYRATAGGILENMALAVIIDGYSASASEIIAGAMQDLDRAKIVGKRSFGKGLVQEQSEWNDGSATRLTVARYYTPNGRSIQRAYESIGNSDIPLNDSLDGGIVPDIKVERDTTGVTWLYAEIIHRGLLNRYAYHFRDINIQQLSQMNFEAFDQHISKDTLAVGMHAFLTDHNVDINEKEWMRSKDRMMLRVKAILGRSLFGDEAYFKLSNRQDLFVEEAIKAIKKTEV